MSAPAFSRRFRFSLGRNRLATLVDARRMAGLPLLDLTESNPTRVGLDYPRAIAAALGDERVLAYEPDPRGLPAARQAIAAYYAERGRAVDPARIVLSASTSEAYAWLFKLLTDPGDDVLVPRPSYPLFDYLAGLEHAELAAYDLVEEGAAGFRLDFDSLERARGARTRAVVAVSPNHPTGSILSAEERQRMDALCAEHGLARIVDQVFSDYRLDPAATELASAESSPLALTFSLSGLSKVVGLPQMKLAWIVVDGPASLVEPALERLELVADTYLSVSTPAQRAVPLWLDCGRSVRGQILERVRGNLAWLEQATRGTPCRTLRVEGGWTVPIEVPRLCSEEEWACSLVERDGVLVHPGYFFDFPREAFLVASLLPEPAVFREAISRLLARVES